MVDQPRLEAIPSTHPEAALHPLSRLRCFPTSSDAAPEAVPHELLDRQLLKPEVVQPLGEREKFFVGVASGETNSVLVDPTPTLHTGPSKQQINIRVGILVLVLVVVVASVVGGVIGSRHSGNNSSTATSPLPTPSSSRPMSTLTPLHSPQPNSRLSASGWRTSGGFFNFRVFYQDQSDDIRFADSEKVEREGILSTTGTGASSIPQLELFFLNKSSLLSGNNFREGTTPLGGLYDSIDEYPVPIHSKSRLGTYWPYIVMQKPDLSLHLVYYLLLNPVKGIWQNRSLGITAPEGTALAIVPLSSSYDDPYPAALIYRRNDGPLGLYSLNYNRTGYDSGAVTIDLPQTSSFGAFAVARGSNIKNATDIYILHQTASNDLEYVYYHGDSWQPGLASDALKNADPSTDITCLTEAVWFGYAVMSTAYDMSRCYFLSGGHIKEVGFDGAMWTDMGYVPLT
ncbi:hypothetical protein F5B21DRAFT_527882 [Xylaria acuta]|nr:hypothetical protein F5B21DRAFT_527882 [Xylaria acuta]